MKVRNCFVANSSSCSFVIIFRNEKDLVFDKGSLRSLGKEGRVIIEDNVEKFVDNFNAGKYALCVSKTGIMMFFNKVVSLLSNGVKTFYYEGYDWEDVGKSDLSTVMDKDKFKKNIVYIERDHEGGKLGPACD